MAPLPRKRVAGGALITDERDRVLLVKPTYKPGWEVPGGIAEPGESPRAATARECREELGVVVLVQRLLVCDWTVAEDQTDDGLMFVFDTAPVDDRRIELALDELAEWRWCTSEDVRSLLSEFMARRILAAQSARRNDLFLELEEGHPA